MGKNRMIIIRKKQLITLCLLMLCIISCSNTPTSTSLNEEEEIFEPGKYIPSVNFKNRPGLYMENGVLMREGEAFAGIGVNFYGAFGNYFLNKNNEFDEMFALLAGYGIEYCRINIGLYWPIDYAKWNQNKQHYFDCMDTVIRSAEQHHIGIICSFFWHWQGISDYFDEAGKAWGNEKSKTRKYMAQYTEQFVNRYMESPAIWGYEFGNEINLQCDLPNASKHRGGTNKALGQRSSRDENDDLSAEIAQSALKQFATIVKKNDKYGRIVTSGCAELRPSQYNQRMYKNWQTDTRKEMAQAMVWFNPPPMDCVSVHIYDLLGRFLPESQNNYVNLIKVYMEEAAAKGQTLFVGEFHGIDKRCEEIIDALVVNRTPVSAVWAVGSVEYSISTDPERQNVVLGYIEEANKMLKK